MALQIELVTRFLNLKDHTSLLFLLLWLGLFSQGIQVRHCVWPEKKQQVKQISLGTNKQQLTIPIKIPFAPKYSNLLDNLVVNETSAHKLGMVQPQEETTLDNVIEGNPRD